ncbi:MAG: PSD1 and planctomycete cytochrome C domain-containing protein, partial [Verrucomicrobiota bacterium]
MIHRWEYFLPAFLLAPGGVFTASAIDDAEREFFETRIRPILAQECYECHSESTKSKGGLLLDTRTGWETGGDSGPVIIPGNPGESLLFQSIAHEIEDLKMPKAGAQLEPGLIEDFRKWIEMGAPDPRDEPPSPEQLSQDTNWEAIRDRRKGWWSFQPIETPEVPEIAGANKPIDRFIQARLKSAGLRPAERADPRMLHRRISFALTGLPPGLEDSKSFLEAWEANPDEALAELVDELLAGQAFGERWARHWMDWMRYAESHGSEGDPKIPHAWQYRDYLIRALNADVPYDQLVVEHLAGDLLAEPRVNELLGLNESAIGTAHLRMVFHGFAPTDALDERVRFTDDQINTVTKAFLGLTVSCARCHDHKFDAISQADYYAMFGIFTSGLPATVAIDAPGVLERNRAELVELKKAIRTEAAAFWLESLDKGGFDLEVEADSLVWLRELLDSDLPGAAWEVSRERFENQWAEVRKYRESGSIQRIWSLSDPAEVDHWTAVGEGLNKELRKESGDFVVGRSGMIDRFLPGGLFSHRLSTKHRGFAASPAFHLDDEYDLYLHAAGEKSSARFSVQHYPRRGTVYPLTYLDRGEWQWVKYNRIDYWKGDEIHLEFATAAEAPIHVKEADRSWFGVREAILVKKGSPSPEAPEDEWLEAIFAAATQESPKNGEDVKTAFITAVQQALEDWSLGDSLSDSGALLLEDLLASGAFPNRDAELPQAITSLLKQYRDLESDLPSPTLAPGIIERPGFDQPLYVRGNHKEPDDPVSRRFLEAIDDTPYETSGSGRLELAADFLREDNPFTARVAVNRIWTHLFGNGLVATVDNFGRLGEEPSHPALLDFLANRFRGELDWSLKALVREVVLSESFQQRSEPVPEAAELDPDNRLLSHFPVRRLDAEAIRDSLLTVSGELELEQYGVSKAPTSKRRAVYLSVIRNNLNPLLTTFDFPVPASTVGKRDSTNVPAQSLTLLNDPFISSRAAAMAKRAQIALGEEAGEDSMIEWMFLVALNRVPSDPELNSARSFL